MQDQTEIQKENSTSSNEEQDTIAFAGIIKRKGEIKVAKKILAPKPRENMVFWENSRLSLSGTQTYGPEAGQSMALSPFFVL